ncbi:MAG: hypothetical protein WAX69_13815, partial [Victivallales bacterium]
MKLFFSLMIAAIIPFSAFSGTRIAIVSDTKSNAQELAVSGLSSDKDIELLERNEIDKILKEQKLSAQSIDEKQVLSLGKLLKTDLFAIIETDAETKNPIGIIVFDAATGIRYWDSALPEADTDKTAKFIVTAVKEAIGKGDKALDGKLTYISLLSVRNADLSREKDPFCKAVGILLMRQLGNSPDIAVLERSHLDWLNKERSLPGMEAQNKLLASTMLLELEICRAKDGKGINANLYLLEKQKLTLESAADDPVAIAEGLTAMFGKEMKLSSQAIKPDVIKEGRRFYSEYKILKGHEKWFEAHEVISAAYGLAPDLFSDKYAESLLDCSIETLVKNGHHARYEKHSPTAEDLEKSLDLMEYYFNSYYLPARTKSKADWPSTGISMFRQHLESIENTGKYKGKLGTRTENLILTLRKQQEKELAEKLDKGGKILPPEKAYSDRILYVYDIIGVAYDKRSEQNLFNEHMPLVNSWLEFTGDFISKSGLPSHSKVVCDLETAKGRILQHELFVITTHN